MKKRFMPTAAFSKISREWRTVPSIAGFQQLIISGSSKEVIAIVAVRHCSYLDRFVRTCEVNQLSEQQGNPYSGGEFVMCGS